MTITASGAQISAFQAIRPPIPSHGTLQYRTTPLDYSSSQEINQGSVQASAARVSALSENAQPVLHHTAELANNNPGSSMVSHVDFVYQNNEIWGVEAWVKAWFPSGYTGPITMAGCNGTFPPGCMLWISYFEFILDLTIPNDTFRLYHYSITPVPHPYVGYQTMSQVPGWMAVPAYTRPYIRHKDKLFGSLITPVIVGSQGISCGKIHGHLIWPGAEENSFIAGNGC